MIMVGQYGNVLETKGREADTWKVGEWKSPDKCELPSPLRLSSQATLSISSMMTMPMSEMTMMTMTTYDDEDDDDDHMKPHHVQ